MLFVGYNSLIGTVSVSLEVDTEGASHSAIIDHDPQMMT